jgi:hypothetical protein
MCELDTLEFKTLPTRSIASFPPKYNVNIITIQNVSYYSMVWLI